MSTTVHGRLRSCGPFPGVALAVGVLVLLGAALAWVLASGGPLAWRSQAANTVAADKAQPQPVSMDPLSERAAFGVGGPDVVATLIAHEGADRGKGLTNSDRPEEGISGRAEVVGSAPPVARWAIVPGRHPGGGRQTCFYFDVDDRLAPRSGAPVAVTVEYLDKGSGSISLDYEATEGAKTRIREAPKPALLSSSGQWRTHRFELPDARFDNGFRGSDLRIRTDTGDEVAIASIAVEMGRGPASRAVPLEVGPVPAMAADAGLGRGDMG